MDSMVQNEPALESSDEGRRLVDIASEVMQVRSARWADRGLGRLIGRSIPAGEPAAELRGRLIVDANVAYERLAERYRVLGYVLLLRRDGDDDVAIAIPGSLPRTSGRPWVAVGLFLATVASVLWLGAMYEGVPGDLLAGWPFALSLLGILVAHEMGHYVVARWLKVPASLPYFIPMPFSPFGTMGAVIQTKAPTVNRRALLLLGASGPLAGLIVTLPVLFLGLSTSPVDFVQPGSGSIQEGNSLLYAGMKLLVFGQVLPSGHMDVFVNSIAWAGWAGLLVTGLNLIPAGQLDGGHIAYALFGRHARWLTWGVVAGLLALSPLWEGWILWAALVLFLGRAHAVPLDDVTPLRDRDKLLAALCLLLFVLVFIPVPMTFQ